ncbi:MAG: universal stress protein [Acidimicrobiia bacterium]
MPIHNNPPPRPGFTRSLPYRNSPVVVAVTESGTGVAALRRAADEAAYRSSPLHVIAGGPAESTLAAVIDDPRELHTVSWILRMPHVTVSVVDQTTPESLIGYCAQVAASLLVIGCDHAAAADSLESRSTARHVVEGARCDVLVVQVSDVLSKRAV